MAFKGVPTLMLLDPEGKVVARDPRGSQIREEVRKALGTPRQGAAPQ